jgi:glutathione peroxidase
VNTFDFSATSLNGEQVDLARYQGKVLLVVNTASKCGFTPQYKALERLYEEYRDRGLVVLGFPCNQFRDQEPGTEGEIGEFCEKNFGVTFPMFAKLDVNGSHADPLFRHLKKEAPGVLGTQAIKWNFTKFLVARDGSVYCRYSPTTTPDDLRADIEKLLG